MKEGTIPDGAGKYACYKDDNGNPVFQFPFNANLYNEYVDTNYAEYVRIWEEITQIKKALKKLGYKYCNVDCRWYLEEEATPAVDAPPFPPKEGGTLNKDGRR